MDVSQNMRSLGHRPTAVEITRKEPSMVL